MTRRLVLVSALPLIATLGCGPVPGPTPATQKAPPSPKEVFEKPAPTDVTHDPRVITLMHTTDRITAALTAIRARLKDLKAALDTKAATEADLAKAATLLKTLTTQAREDCDAILRTAKDLRTELPLARKGYAATAELYRDRAATVKDETLKAVTLKMAAEFDRLAADSPRRVALTDEFIASLIPMQEFLAEADRCLTDTKTALAILSAGAEPVRVSEEAKVFRRQLEAFTAVLDEYQQKLLGSAPPTPAAPTDVDPWASPTPATDRCPPGKTPKGATLVSDPSRPGKEICQPQYCEVCRSYHVRTFRVAPDPRWENLEIHREPGGK